MALTLGQTRSSKDSWTMGKRFVPVRNAGQRAIALYKMLREVEQMPLLALRVGDGPQPIVLYEVSNPRGRQNGNGSTRVQFTGPLNSVSAHTNASTRSGE